MDPYEKEKLKKIRKTIRQLKQGIGAMSDIFGTDGACRNMRLALDQLAATESQQALTVAGMIAEERLAAREERS